MAHGAVVGPGPCGGNLLPCPRCGVGQARSKSCSAYNNPTKNKFVMNASQRGVLLLAHGTVEHEAELPAFLTRIRRGKPPSEELLHEMQRRYRAIGGSPLLRITRQQASALSKHLGLPCAAAMRLSAPEVETVVPELLAQGVTELCLLPLAPFSVGVYVDAARRAIAGLGQKAAALKTVAVAPWGQAEGFVAAQVAAIRGALAGRPGGQLILTAHSLPQQVIAMGDQYAALFEACARSIAAQLDVPWCLAYQSQGADGHDWLGPTLYETMVRLREQGASRILVAPVGFVAEHVETLYDLDIEAQAQAAQLGVEFSRVAAVSTVPGFIAALGQAATAAFNDAAASNETAASNAGKGNPLGPR
jgi:protoporphyrin/coproporphyrin ferrochelatase